MKDIRELRCWVLSLRMESMINRYMEDGCTFDLTVTQRITNFGTIPWTWRRVSVDLGQGANGEGLEEAVEWLKAATHGDVIFN